MTLVNAGWIQEGGIGHIGLLTGFISKSRTETEPQNLVIRYILYKYGAHVETWWRLTVGGDIKHTQLGSQSCNMNWLRFIII